MPLKVAMSAAVIAGALTAAAGQVAGDDAVTAFDGTYFGRRERISPLSGDLCANHTLHSLTIAGGRLSGDGGDISGTVNGGGFFTGTIMVFGLVQLFEGRIANGTLLGGVTSPDGACFWLMRMTRLDGDG